MKQLTVSRKEWEAFRDWESRELIQMLPAFRVNFMTETELGQIGEPEPEGPLDDEADKNLLDEMEAWEERRKADLLALAESLGCSIYLAAYLKHLDEKLETIAEVFGNHRVMMRDVDGA